MIVVCELCVRGVGSDFHREADKYRSAVIAAVCNTPAAAMNTHDFFYKCQPEAVPAWAVGDGNTEEALAEFLMRPIRMPGP